MVVDDAAASDRVTTRFGWALVPVVLIVAMRPRFRPPIIGLFGIPALVVRNEPYCRLKDTACTLDISALYFRSAVSVQLTSHSSFVLMTDSFVC